MTRAPTLNLPALDVPEIAALVREGALALEAAQAELRERGSDLRPRVPSGPPARAEGGGRGDDAPDPLQRAQRAIAEAARLNLDAIGNCNRAASLISMAARDLESIHTTDGGEAR